MKTTIPTGPLRHVVRLSQPVRRVRSVAAPQASNALPAIEEPLAEAAALAAVEAVSPDPDSAATEPQPPQPDPTALVTALQEQTSETWSHIEAEIVEVEQRRQQSVDEMRLVAIEMAVAIAARVAGELVEADKSRISTLITEAIELFQVGEPITIALNPDDLANLDKALDGRPPPWGNEDTARLKADARVAEGSCEVLGADFRYVSRMGLVLDEIRTGLLESLEHAQVERRKSQAEGEALKRFPDRRETA